MKTTEQPKITIITVCYNAQHSIQQTIESVTQQTYKNIEYIIVDGRSTDETLSIINEHSTQIAKIISEEDKGIYEAMNKGLKYSSGVIIYFLNADDRLYSHSTIEKVIKQFHKNPLSEIICGKVEYENIPPEYLYNFKKRKFNFPKKLYALITTNPQQRIFVRKSVYDKIGEFNTTYKICADYDWLLRSYSKKINRLYYDQHFAYYDTQGRSYQTKEKMILEKIKVIRKNSSLPEFIFYLVYASVRKIFHIFLENCIANLKNRKK